MTSDDRATPAVGAELPYELPSKWTTQRARREPAWRIALWIAGYAYGTWRMFVHLLDGSVGWAIAQLIIFGVVGLLAVGEFWLAGGERGRPEFVNAVALTRARVRPADSWVHLFRERRAPAVVVVGVFVLSGVALTGSVWSCALTVRQNVEWLLLLTIPIVLVAAIGLLAAFALLLIRVRVGSFGRRPMGVALGRAGITVLELDDVVEHSWSRVCSVKPITLIGNDRSGDFAAAVEIATDSGSFTIAVGGMDAHAWLIYTAVRFWAEHPDDREELSTTFGQRRILNWHAAMHAS